MILVKYIITDNPKTNSHKLLSESLFEFCDIKNAQALITKTEHGKPQIDGCVFSISHSKNVLCVALSCNKQKNSDTNTFLIDECALADSIGVDIESVFDKDFDRCKKIAETKFFESENTLLSQCKTKSEYINLFCDMWTKKESYCKYTGIGLKDAIGFDTTVAREDVLFYTDDILIDDKSYSMSVCYNSK